MKALTLLLMAVIGLLQSTALAQTLIVTHTGPCDSYTYDISKICHNGQAHNVGTGQCKHMSPPTTQQVWGLGGYCTDNPARIQVWGHTCGLPGEEFLVFDGYVAAGDTAYVEMPGTCPPLDDHSDGGDNCEKCCGGMPVWGVSDYVNLWVHDEPLSYQPAAGPRVSFRLDFKQREDSAGMDPKIFSAGKRWNLSWLSYVGLNSSGTNYVHFPNGRERSFTNAQDYITNTRLSGDTNSGFTLSYPDGSEGVYGWIVNNAGGSFLKAFMTEERNAAGQKTLFYYTNYPSGPVTRLLYVVDGDGRTNTIHYVSANPYSTNLISEIIDPFNRTNILRYDTSGHLTNSVDTAKISSFFAYDSSDRVSSFTTPYGTSSFQVTVERYDNSSANNRSVLVTQPDGGHALYLSRDAAVGALASYPAAQVPVTDPFTNSFDNAELTMRNVFYWGPRQYSHLSTTNVSDFTADDYRKARMRHFLNTSYNLVGRTLSLERDPSPDDAGTIEGQITWYDYAGKTNAQYEGTQSQPLFVARVLPDGSTSFTRTERNSWGAVTNSIGTYSVGGSVLLRTNSFGYSSDGIDMITSTNALGIQVSSNIFNTYHQVATNFDALGEATIYTYDGSHLTTSIARPSGLVTTNIYDASGHLIITYDYASVGGPPVFYRTNSYTYTNDLVFTHTDERGLTITNTWDPLERLIKTDFPDGSFVSNVYPALDLTATRDRMGNWTYFGYDSMRRRIAETNALGFYSTNSYCTCGSLESTTDAGGNTTSFFYDNQGRLTSTAYADGYTVTSEYDLLGRITNSTDSAGMGVTNWFNNQGLLIASSNALGQVRAVGYDAIDRAVTNTDANGITVVTAYDDLNRVLSRAYPDAGVEHFGYSLGVIAMTAYTNQDGDTSGYLYDPLGRKTAETNGNFEVTQFGYSPAGDLASLTDGKNQTTTWHYDEYGQATNKVDAASNVIFKYQYDADGRLTNRWTPVTGDTAYGYDAAGNLLTISYQRATNDISMAYDMLNRMTNMVDSVGTNRYSYDSVGQLLSEDGPWSSDTVTYTYANRLRTGLSLAQPLSPAWTNGYGYDIMRRLTNVISPAGAFGYRYVSGSPSMLVSSRTLPNGSHIENDYDEVKRLIETQLMNSTNGVVAWHAYDVSSAGRRFDQYEGDAVHEHDEMYTYDRAQQLISSQGVESDLDNTPRLQEQLGYFYDAAGNLNRRTNNALVETFDVNSLNELTTQTHSGTLTVAGFTTTPATNVTVNGLSAEIYGDNTFAKDGFTIANGLNLFTAVARNASGQADTNTISVNLPATTAFVYDLNGNLRTNGTRILDYDDENQLIAITEPSAWRSEFQYDGKMRRRIRREYTWSGGAWSLTNTVLYVYDGNVVVQERDATDLPQVTYTRGLDLSSSFQGAGGIGGLLARSQPSAPTAQDAFYFCDGNGNVTSMVNTNQLVVAKYSYDSFGNVQVSSGPLAEANLYRFSSKEEHLNSGLVYYGYRYYVPGLQRWVNRDRLGDVLLFLRDGDVRHRSMRADLLGRYAPLALQPFTYVKNSPNDLFDPLGLDAESCFQDCLTKAQGQVLGLAGHVLSQHRLGLGIGVIVTGISLAVSTRAPVVGIALDGLSGLYDYWEFSNTMGDLQHERMLIRIAYMTCLNHCKCQDRGSEDAAREFFHENPM